MNGQSEMFSLTTCGDSTSAIGSQESAAGPMHVASPASRTTSRSGPAHVPVSRFRALASDEALPTNAISGPLFPASSLSAALQSSLESRLRALMDVNGSPEFVLTWKTQDMPAGLPICRLQASARRTVANACSGAAWPTPKASDERGGMAERFKGADSLNGRRSNLNDAMAAAWATPTLCGNHNRKGASPTSGDGLATQIIGATPNGSHATTAKCGAPNPAFPCWLMGYPAEWLYHAPAPRRRAKSAAPPPGGASETP